MAGVWLVDDHPIFRRGLAAVLTAAGHVLLGEGADGETGLTLLQQASDDDVAVIDIGLPGIDGIAMLRRARSLGCQARVVVLSLHNEVHIVRAALEAGADGYVLKERAEQEVVDAVAAALGGRRFVSAPLGAALSEDAPSLDRLTPAELRVLRLLADNRTSAEIAAELGLSLRTVQNHRAHAVEKLGLSGANRLLQFALEHRRALVDLVTS